MSIAPPPAYPTWPPSPYPPAPQKPHRRWPAVAAAAGIGAIIAGSITTLVTYAATSPEPTHTTAAPAPSTVTETAGPPPSPAPLPVAEADAQTCRGWRTSDKLVTAGTAAIAAIPDGMKFTDPAVQNNPAWKAAVSRASDLFGQAANTFEAQIAAGASPMLAQVSDTTVSSLRTLAEAYRTFDPISANSVPVFQANQKALDWLCQ